MAYVSREQLFARCAMHEATIEQLQRELAAATRDLEASGFECRNLQAMVNSYMAAAHQVADTEAVEFTGLALRCKRLNQQGVPALIHRGNVLHSRTRAVIAPGSYGLGT